MEPILSRSWTSENASSTRLDRKQIERRLLDTATEAIRSNGLTVSLEHLRLDDLMRKAKVPKTSFYRVWSSKDAFFAQLLGELVQPEGGVGAAYDEETLRVARDVIVKNQDRLSTLEGRNSVLREAIRVGAKRNFTAVREAASWQIYMAVLATLPSVEDPRARDEIRTTLQIAENRFIDTMAAFYGQLLPVLGRRLRDGLTTRHFAAAGAAIVEGLIQRYVVNPDLVDAPVPGPSIDGGVADWHLSALGFLGIAEIMTEPDDGSREVL